jgi:glycosyltransferase involved in cell wall biosynthesis
MTKTKIVRITTVPISLRKLLPGQLKFMNRYFEMFAISSSDSHLEIFEKEEGVKVLKVNMKRRPSIFDDAVALFNLLFVLNRIKPLIVHSHTPKAGLLGMIASYLLGVKVRIHTVAGIPWVNMAGFNRYLFFCFEWLTYKLSTHVLSNSVNQLDFIISSGLIKKDKISVIGNGSSNGIDLSYFELNDLIVKIGEEIKSKLEINNEKVIIFVGRIVKDKGIEDLINAFELIEQDFVDIKLLLVGPEEDHLDPISELIKNKILLNNNIISTGYVEDVRPYYAIADILAFPSHREGFPNVLLQAGAMNLPIVASNINGCNEIIKDNENGILFPAGDHIALYKSINKLLTDSEYFNYLKINSRKIIAANYDQLVFWDNLKNYYDKRISNLT